MGTAPNAAASAQTNHPVVQGQIQSLGVFVDTIVICTATAAIILISGVPLEGSDGIAITQSALLTTVGPLAPLILTLCIFFFAFSTVLGIYFYAQANYEFLIPSGKGLNLYKMLVVLCVFIGSLSAIEIVWELGDIATALMAVVNLFVLLPLMGKFMIVLKDYQKQRKSGILDPVFNSKDHEEFKDLDVWHK